VTTCWCGMRHAVPSELYDFQWRQHRDGKPVTSVYCPLGHTHVPAGESEAEKLRRQLKWAQDRRNAERDLRQHTERQLIAQRAAATRARNQRDRIQQRAAAGVCPCCNRTFKQLARHMKAKHPDFGPEGPDA
jgi:crotonobetainyl-CoA:carnitine CoA-transferase CaiB-like acyl-CoA transferase